jgi:hypothetical protein
MVQQPSLVVVTATADYDRAQTFLETLYSGADNAPPTVLVTQGSKAQRMRVASGVVVHSAEFLGVVPAFALGCEYALRTYPQAEVMACLHDDVLLHERRWDTLLVNHFQQYPQCGLAGFGGAWGLGDEHAGQGEYRPTWLVRRGFMSHMTDAEQHGIRCRVARPVAVLDGFSLIFRRAVLTRQYRVATHGSLFSLLQRWGIVHHAYDAALGAITRDLGWDTWYLPFACTHLGGQTAVGERQYADWARKQRPRGGDQQFWEEAHQIVWQKLGHLLPFTVGDPVG